MKTVRCTLFYFVSTVLFLTGSVSPEAIKNQHESIYDQADHTKELTSLIQHFAYITHKTMILGSKLRNDSLLSKSDNEFIVFLEQSYEKIVDSARLQFQQQETFNAIADPFGIYLLKIIRKFKLNESYTSIFRSSITKFDRQASAQKKISLIKKYISLFEARCSKVEPNISLIKRIENKLFYNFISTKVTPNALRYGVGPLVSILWLLKKYSNYNIRVAHHPHESIWVEYTEHPHDTEKDYIKEPTFVQQAFGMGAEEESNVNSCRQGYYTRDVCNGPKKQPEKEEKPKQESPKPTRQQTPQQQIQNLLQNVNQLNNLNQQNNEANERNLLLQMAAMFVQQNAPPPEVVPKEVISKPERINWTHKECTGSSPCDKKCYHYRGYRSIDQSLKDFIPSLSPLLVIPLCNFLAKTIEEAQLPEYERRIKEKQKREKEEKIFREMKSLKINYEKEIGFAQIKGLKNLIDSEIKLIVDYLTNPFRYKNSASGTRSLLLYGPPGTGKTLLARAIAKESGAPFIELTADDILSDNSKDRILGTIRLAEEVAAKRPEKSAIIYIDEIDAVTGNREKETLDTKRSKALSNLLTIFDGIEKRNPFIHIQIIITTNHYEKLDAALLRPGRIDRKALIAEPDAQGRSEFFEALLPDERKALIPWLVEVTKGYTGAQIVNIIDTARMVASYYNMSLPSEEHYRKAFEKVKDEKEMMPESAKSH